MTVKHNKIIGSIHFLRYQKRQNANVDSYSDSINPALIEYMNLYKIPSNSRRWFEYELFIGYPFFMAGRNKLPDGSIKFSPYPLHPILRWLYYR